MTNNVDTYLIGLRLDPDVPDPQLYTWWFEGPDGKNRVATREGRILWASSNVDASALLDTHSPVTPSAGAVATPPELSAYCDIPSTLYGIDGHETGAESTVLLALNLLDDLVFTTGHPLSASHQQVLDRLVSLLTVGTSLPEALTDVDATTVIEAIYSSLGRVLAFSDFTTIQR